MTLILGFDTETSGLPPKWMTPGHPEYPRIVEIAAILVDEETVAEVAVASFIVRPDDWAIPDEAAAVHGITTERAIRVGVPLAVAIAAYTNLRAVADEIVGHNLEFDLRMVASEINRLGARPAHPGPPTNRMVCTAEIGTPIARLPPTERMIEVGFGDRFKRPTLNELYRHLFGVEVDGAHSALVDARAAVRCLLEIRRRNR